MTSNAGAPDRTAQSALVALHAAAGTFGTLAGLDMAHGLDLDLPAPSAAMQAVADADHSEIPVGSRLDALVALAKAGNPGIDADSASYRNLAGSLGVKVKPDQVLEDAKAIAGGAAVEVTKTGQALKGTNSIAFVGEELCSVQQVTVNGKPAIWVFSEFETNADFESVAEWVDPENWSERAPTMFKHMALQDTEVAGFPPSQKAPLPGPGVRWHGNFQEEVEFGKYLVTGLHCDFAKEDTFAVVTYKWNWSRGDQISVDRGFLMVNDLGPNRQVKVLKIVAFSDPTLNRYAETICPNWTDFIRGAVRNGDKHLKQKPTTIPGLSFLGPNMRELLNIYQQSAEDYMAYLGYWSREMMSGDYQPRQMMTDTLGYWSELTRDFARAWTAGNDMLRGMAGAGRTFAAFGGPGGRGDSESEGTTIPMPDIDVNTKFAVSDLELLGATPSVIPAAKVDTNLVRLEGGALGIHVEAATQGTEVGMYLGELTYGPNNRKRPVQLYVSHSQVTSS